MLEIRFVCVCVYWQEKEHEHHIKSIFRQTIETINGNQRQSPITHSMEIDI